MKRQKMAMKKISDYNLRVKLEGQDVKRLTQELASDVQEIYGLNKNESRLLIYNALQYQTVSEAILDQIQYMLGDDPIRI